MVWPSPAIVTFVVSGSRRSGKPCSDQEPDWTLRSVNTVRSRSDAGDHVVAVRRRTPEMNPSRGTDAVADVVRVDEQQELGGRFAGFVGPCRRGRLGGR